MHHQLCAFKVCVNNFCERAFQRSSRRFGRNNHLHRRCRSKMQSENNTSTQPIIFLPFVDFESMFFMFSQHDQTNCIKQSGTIGFHVYSVCCYRTVLTRVYWPGFLLTRIPLRRMLSAKWHFSMMMTSMGHSIKYDRSV